MVRISHSEQTPKRWLFLFIYVSLKHAHTTLLQPSYERMISLIRKTYTHIPTKFNVSPMKSLLLLGFPFSFSHQNPLIHHLYPMCFFMRDIHVKAYVYYVEEGHKFEKLYDFYLFISFNVCPSVILAKKKVDHYMLSLILNFLILFFPEIMESAINACYRSRIALVITIKKRWTMIYDLGPNPVH